MESLTWWARGSSSMCDGVIVLPESFPALDR